LTAGAVLLASATGLYTPATYAAEPAQTNREGAKQRFNIPPQALGRALTEFEAATGVQIEMQPAQIAGKHSPGVQGEMTAQQALARLLAGTGLEYEPAASGRVTLVGGEDGGSPAQLSPIEVVGTQNPDVTDRHAVLRAFRTSKTEDSIDGETARSYNSANNYDALRAIPGVNFMNGQGSRFGAPSRIRGSQSWTVADGIDDYPTLRPAGIGAEDGGFAATPGSLIPAIALDSIEVQKGGLGVQYGGDADGGVIVSRIKQGHAGAPSGTVWAEVNPLKEQLLMADVAGGTDDGKWDYYVAGKALNGDYDEVSDQSGDQLEQDQLASAIAKIGFNPDDDSRLELLTLVGQDQVEYVKTLGPDAGDRFETTNRKAFMGLNYEQELSTAWSYDLGYTFLRDRAVRFSLADDESHRDRPQTAHTVFANAYYQAGLSENVDYTLGFGAEYVGHNQREEAENAAAKDFDFNDTSVYALNTLTFDDRLSFTGGLRFVDARDDFRNQNIVLYDLGAAYTLTGGTTVRVNRSTGYGRNKGFIYFFGPIEEAGGAPLTESETTEVGIGQVFRDGSGATRGEIELSVFRTDYENAPTFSGWGDAVVYTNDTRAEGIELSADWRPVSSVRVFGSFAYVDTEVQSTTDPSGGGVGSTAVPVPNRSAALGLDWQMTQKLRVETIATYDKGMRTESVDISTGDVTVTERDDYTRWNLAAYYEYSPRLTFLVRGENLLNDKDLGFSSTTEGPGGTTNEDLVAQDPGRYVSVGLQYRW